MHIQPIVHKLSPRKLWIAYLWLLFLGPNGAQKFYLGRPRMGLLYLLTGGLFGIGLLYDLLTMSRQVRQANDAIELGLDFRTPREIFSKSSFSPYPTESSMDEMIGRHIAED